jgi:hypothetical protein
MKINKALAKRLKKLSNKELLIEAQSFKILNRVEPYSSSNKFQLNYNTVLEELKLRNLLKGGKK